MTLGTTTKIHFIACNECRKETRHALVNEYDVRGTAETLDDEGEPVPFDLIETLECQGCEAVTVRRTFWDGHGLRQDADRLVLLGEEISFLPARTARARPDWLSTFDQRELRLILLEIYAALDVGALTLVAMGIRTAIDMIANQVVGDVGNFPTKLDALEKKGWLGAMDRKRLGIVVDAGNAAAHRGFRANATAISHMMETIEHLLKSRYVMDAQAKALKKATPQRRKAAKPKP